MGGADPELGHVNFKMTETPREMSGGQAEVSDVAQRGQVEIPGHRAWAEGRSLVMWPPGLLPLWDT